MITLVNVGITISVNLFMLKYVNVYCHLILIVKTQSIITYKIQYDILNEDKLSVTGNITSYNNDLFEQIYHATNIVMSVISCI